jgi:hypothetical protein
MGFAMLSPSYEAVTTRLPDPRQAAISPPHDRTYAHRELVVARLTRRRRRLYFTEAALDIRAAFVMSTQPPGP